MNQRRRLLCGVIDRKSLYTCFNGGERCSGGSGTLLSSGSARLRRDRQRNLPKRERGSACRKVGSNYIWLQAVCNSAAVAT